ncbi:PEP-CTERM sorting domain-containing protein [Corallincola holothuriorum]|uniref:PEP-CTERM sorting domain-containing protein n=1 Tax=Corallincola holothuriorum TaxID=2282215 RepID=A0A368NJU9_9GAMM|nr:PEP-CTERM sorting domain-containing protein [Corallincola holothuriorum]RCU50055.1 PEP-CTERM sorting domain-containing protein [Corallincola holothuriorum]
MLNKPYVLLFVAMFSAQTQAGVLSFEDVTAGNSSFLPINYAGFNWGEQAFGVIIDQHPSYSFQGTFGNSYGSPSGDYALYNSNGVNQGVRLNSIIDFNGAYFSSWANNNDFGDYGATSITINGYNSGILIDSKTMDLSANQYDWFDVGFSGVDELEFVTSGVEKWWVMDDFTYSTSQVAEVPEPASLGVFLAGVFGLLLTRKKPKC